MSVIVYWRSKVKKMAFWHHPEGMHTKDWDWKNGSALEPEYVARESCYEDYCHWCKDQDLKPYDIRRFYSVSSSILYPNGDKTGRFSNLKANETKHIKGEGYVTVRVSRSFIKVPSTKDIENGILELTGFSEA
jgi:hypothetical protein